jgi:hypothetical protein
MTWYLAKHKNKFTVLRNWNDFKGRSCCVSECRGENTRSSPCLSSLGYWPWSVTVVVFTHAGITN